MKRFCQFMTCMLVFPCLVWAQPVTSSWSATVVQDWQLDFNSYDEEVNAGISVVKLRCEPGRIGFDNSPVLADLIYYAVAMGQIPIFEDSGLTRLTTWEAAVFPQLIVVDASSGEEKMLLGCRDIEPRLAFSSWRLLQRVTYDARKAAWATEVLAVAPLTQDRDHNGDVIQKRPLFWFKPANKRPQVDHKHITWAKTAKSLQPGTLIPISDFPSGPLADTLHPVIMAQQHLLENRMDVPLYSEEGVLLSANARRDMVYWRDTLLNCWPVDDTEPPVFYAAFNTFYDVQYLRLYQTWYWDRRRHQLSVCLDAVAPMQDHYSSEGDFRYRKPKFIWRR